MAILFASLVFMEESQGGQAIMIDLTENGIRQDDILVIYISPSVENLKAEYDFLSSGSGNSWLYTELNSSKRSIMEFSPKSWGIYNLTLMIRSTENWSFTVGVYTTDPKWYSGFYKNVTSIPGGYYVEFFTIGIFPPGNHTLNILLYSYKTTQSVFDIQLPTSVNAIFFIIAAAFIVYLNAFFLSDSFFKNKTEGVSRKRWILSGLLIALSLYIIYQIYLFTTFTSPWSM